MSIGRLASGLINSMRPLLGGSGSSRAIAQGSSGIRPIAEGAGLGDWMLGGTSATGPSGSGVRRSLGPRGSGVPDFSYGGVTVPTKKAAPTASTAPSAKPSATPTASPTPSTPGSLGSDQWATTIAEEAANYADIPDIAEVAQAIMELESGGKADAQGVVVTSGPYAGQRAQGLMQIMPGNYPGEDLLNPRNNIKRGMEMLAQRYKMYGNWDKAVAAYFGAIDGNGNITGARDDNGTDGWAYVNTVNKHRNAIRANRQPRVVPERQAGNYSMIWGGVNAPISQEYGHTDYASGGEYDSWTATYGMGPGQHPGLDIGVGYGTQIYSPAAGKVIIVGGNYYTSKAGEAPGSSGELAIETPDGDIVILGHMGSIDVQVGQTIGVGQAVGKSGTNNGDHLHWEVRQRDMTMPSGYRLVDPRQWWATRGPGARR